MTLGFTASKSFISGWKYIPGKFPVPGLFESISLTRKKSLSDRFLAPIFHQKFL